MWNPTPGKMLAIMVIGLPIALILLTGYTMFLKPTVFENEIDISSIEKLKLSHQIAKLPITSDVERVYYDRAEGGPTQWLRSNRGGIQVDIMIFSDDKSALMEFLGYRSEAIGDEKNDEPKLSQDVIISTYDRCYVSHIVESRSVETYMPDGAYSSSVGFIKNNVVVHFYSYTMKLPAENQRDLQNLIDKTVEYITESQKG